MVELKVLKEDDGKTFYVNVKKGELIKIISDDPLIGERTVIASRDGQVAIAINSKMFEGSGE